MLEHVRSLGALNSWVLDDSSSKKGRASVRTEQAARPYVPDRSRGGAEAQAQYENQGSW